MTDQEILLGMEHNPDKTFSHIIDTYTNYIYTIVYSKLNTCCSKEDIEECVSDIFYEFYKNYTSIDLSKGTIKVFFSVLSKRRAIDLYRKYIKKKEQPLEHEMITTLSSTSQVHSTEDHVVEKERNHQLLDAIKQLSTTESEILMRKYYIGQTSKEIASELNLKPNTVDKKASRSLIKLRQLLESSYV